MKRIKYRMAHTINNKNPSSKESLLGFYLYKKNWNELEGNVVFEVIETGAAS